MQRLWCFAEHSTEAPQPLDWLHLMAVCMYDTAVVAGWRGYPFGLATVVHGVHRSSIWGFNQHMRHWFLKCYARNLQGIRTRSVHLCCHPRFPRSMTMGGHLLLVLITILASSVSGYVNAEHDSIPRDSISVTDLRVNDLGEKGSDGYLQLFVEETSWYNSIVLGSLLPRRIWSPLPHALQSWTRNYVAGNILYFVSGGLWCFYIYYLKRHVYFPKDGIPSKEPIFMQIMVSMKAMPLYCALPVLSEFMVEKGWTRCFARLSEVGLPAYIFLTILYLVLVEFGIYWMHRELHDIKPLYKYLHATHHIYNKQNTLSPFAGLAFNPLDGILQAVPHVIALFLVPTHFFTHMALLFCEGVWTTNIHDCIHGKVWPVMGAGYHTIHHTTYRHNYGHYTIWMDWMFGTLRDPTLEPKSFKNQ